MLGFCPKVGVGDVHIVVSAHAARAVAVHSRSFYPRRTGQAGWPRVVIWVHSGIEVAQYKKLFIVGDAAADGCEELVFCIRCCGHCSGTYADKGDWARTGVSRKVRSLSEPLLPDSLTLSSLFLTAEPTRCSPS